MTKASIFIICIVIFSSAAFAESEENEKLMLDAMKSKDLALFKTLLSNGVNPNLPTEGSRYRTTSLCESTKPGNEAYFSLIVNEGVSLEHKSDLTDSRGSPLLCSIHYGNFPIYKEILSLGIDVNAVQNLRSKGSVLERRPLSFALRSNRAAFAWDIIQRIEINETQKSRIIRFVNGNSGIEGNPNQIYREKIIQWSIEQGFEVNPQPSAPRSLYERKK